MLNRKRDPAVKTVRPAARITMRLSTTSWYRGYDLRYQTLKKATEQHKWSDITNRGCFKKKKVKVWFYIALYPVHWTAQSALHFPPLADLFIPTPFSASLNCYALSTVCVIMISRGLTFRIADEIVGRIC